LAATSERCVAVAPAAHEAFDTWHKVKELVAGEDYLLVFVGVSSDSRFPTQTVFAGKPNVCGTFRARN
jgi:hypothetical protein